MFNLFQKQSIIGIDISDYSIEVLKLDKNKEILAYGRVILERNIIQNGKILEKEKLLEKIREVLENTEPYKLKGSKLKVILSLPESKTFVYLLKVSADVNKRDLREVIQEQSSKIIPLDKESISWDYMEIENSKESLKSKNFKQVLFVGAFREIIDEYVEVMNDADIDVVAMDMESLSLGRALLATDYFEKLGRENNLGASSMIVDIGARATNISIFDSRNILNLSVSAPIAGNYFTEAIIKKFKVGEIEAEKLKRSLGFDDKKDNPILPVLKTIFQKVVDEISQAIAYYEERSNEKIQGIILAGGSSLTPKIGEYLSTQLGKKVKIGDPLRKISAKVKRNGKLLEKSELSIIFANVIGLALRAVDDISAGINLFSRTKKSKNKKQDNKIKIKNKMSFNLNFLKNRIFVIIFIIIAFTALGFVVYQYIYAPFNQAREIPAEEVNFPESESLIIEELGSTTEDMIEEGSDVEIKEVVEIEIQDTPTGWLNVRGGPGTSFPKITKVNPDEIYELLEESGNWYKIKIPANSADREKDVDGWVISDYAVKK